MEIIPHKEFEPTGNDILVDATALSFLRCARNFQLRVLWGFTTPKPEWLALGSVTHKLIELHSSGKLPKNPMELLGLLDKYGLNAEKHMATLLKMAPAIKQFPYGKVLIDRKGVPGIEYRFLIKYGTLLETFNVYLAGTMDRIEEMQELPGVMHVIDWKTTSKQYGPWAANAFAMSLQLYFYLYVLKHFLRGLFDEALSGAVARIMAIHYTSTPVMIQPSSFVELTEQVEDSIPRILDDSLTKIAAIIELGTELAYPEGLMYGACERCDFWEVCSKKNKHEAMDTLHSQYTKKPYNPLKHGDD